MALPFYQVLRTFLLLIAMFSFCRSEIFLALTHMTDFVHLEQTFGSYLEEYLQHNPSAPSDLRRLANDVQLHVKAIEDDDMEVFLGHPVNSYLFVSRFLKEWRNVVNKLDGTDPFGQGKNFGILKKKTNKYNFPASLRFLSKRVERGYNVLLKCLFRTKLYYIALERSLKVKCDIIIYSERHWTKLASVRILINFTPSRIQ